MKHEELKKTLILNFKTNILKNKECMSLEYLECCSCPTKLKQNI